MKERTTIEVEAPASAPFALPDLSALLGNLAGEAQDAHQEAEKAAAWREAMLSEARAQTAALAALSASMVRLEGKLEQLGAGGIGALLRR